MSQKPSQEQLTERFDKLPTELRKAISSVVNADTIFDIGGHHGLMIDKTGNLAEEVGYVILGFTRPKDFVGQLANALQVDTQTAQAIASDVNKEIFLPVREHLRNLHNDANAFSEKQFD